MLYAFGWWPLMFPPDGGRWAKSSLNTLVPGLGAGSWPVFGRVELGAFG